jgi:hypothetical protein
MDSITITNTKIINYFNEHNIDPEYTILFFVDILEKLGDNMIDNINTSINKKILDELNENNKMLKTINDSISKINVDITNSLYLKMLELKKDYIEDTKTLILSNTNEKVSTLLEKNNSHLLDKTTLIFNELIPKTNNAIYNNMNEKITNFQSTIISETDKIIKLIDNDPKSAEKYINTLELKFSQLLQNIQQPIHMYINSSEERINKNITEIQTITRDNITIQNKLYGEMSEFLSKYRVSNYKGSFNENQLYNVLNEMYDDAEVLTTTKQSGCGDFMLKRFNKPTIMFENKDHTEKVYESEVKKFIRDAENVNSHSVFLSQHSGIVNKKNYQIECHKGLILVYIHFVDYSPEKIKIAIDIIDNLESKLKEICENDYAIDKHVLSEIYEEYQNLAIQKDNLIGAHKDFGKKINTILEELNFSSLEKYLSTHFSCNMNISKLSNQMICDNCNKYTCTTIKSMSAHKRACKKST